ncbi:MAG: hypothetical protein C0457_06480 [Polymorphum sp.]|uniref:hypothetical protein n=1 Tax=Pannonibacter indicus TaxID=466044 RepID=UPI001DF7AD44|nr:hypothetical protein [Polymorphum sp.]
MRVEQSGETLVSKGEFARLINVSPGRVSQYFTERKLGPEVLVGEGRMAKIRYEQAVRQLQERLDIGQRLGNGIDTRLDVPSAPQPQTQIQLQQPEAARPAPARPAPEPPSVSAPPDEFESLETQIKREKLRDVQYRNRKAAEEEAARAGRFIEADGARAQMALVASSMLQTFEGGLNAFAEAIAAKFRVPQRDVVFLLQEEFRRLRDNASRAAAERAAQVPKMTESEIISED